MKIIFLLVTVCIFKAYSLDVNPCVTSQSARPPDPKSRCCGVPPPSKKIIKDKYAEIDEYPWLVIVEYYDRMNATKLLCTGSLISSRYVVTAAHCVSVAALNLYTPKSIRLGEYDKANNVSSADCVEVAGDGIDCTDPPVSIPIESITVHPEYNAKAHINDIALIRMKTPAPYTDFIRPVCLPTFDITKDSKERRLWTVGWAEGNAPINKKQYANIPYVPLESCAPKYNNRKIRRKPTLWNKQVCAGGEKILEFCRGNSGAPLMLATEDHFELVGAVSFGYYCGLRELGVPDVFTNIFAYNDWIRKTIVD